MKNTGKIIILITILLLSTEIIFAQGGKILVRGTVISATDDLPIVGATVAEINSDNRTVNGVVTNLDGNFSILVSSNKNTLSFSFVGYKKQQMVVGENTAIKITLYEMDQLKEIVVRAKPKQRVGSLDIDERDISMSISKLSADEISELNVASVDEALQGRMAGVDIMANSGEP